MSEPSSSLPYYVWEPPGKAMAVRLHFDVVDRILPGVMRGFGALPRRGAEVGGVLLGRVEPGATTTVSVEDFEPVPCEYLLGPSYNLSERDRAKLEDTLARCQSRPLKVVGFYRSHTRKDLYLDDADVALCARYFANPSNVVLLIKPFATRTSIAGFFFWEEGEIHRDQSYLEFAFHRRELGGGEPRLVEPPPAETPPAVEPSRPAPAPVAGVEDYRPPLRTSPLSILSAPPPAPPTAPRTERAYVQAEAQPVTVQKRDRRWLWAPAALAMAALAGVLGFLYSKGFLEPAPAAGNLPLHLAVREIQDQLEVNWDRSTPAITTAVRGILTIQDGSSRRDLELSGSQLRDGRVRYSRLTTDVSLRLEVFTADQRSVSESLRFIGEAPKHDLAGTQPETPPATLPAAESKPVPPPAEPPGPAATPTAVEKPPARPLTSSTVRGRPETAKPTESASLPAPERKAQPAPPAVVEPMAEAPPEREVPKPTRRR